MLLTKATLESRSASFQIQSGRGGLDHDHGTMTTAAIGAVQLARLLDSWRHTGTPGRQADYLRLAGAVRGLIRDGRLALGTRLPAERGLCEVLSTSRTTVTAAYGTLREQGYLVSRRGSGSYTAMPDGQRFSTSGLWSAATDPDLIDLSCAAPDAPDELADAAREAAELLPRHAAGHGYHPAGLPELREVVADRFSRRGLPTSPGQIVVTAGAQQAFDVILRLLVAPGERVLVESPSYPNALAALGHHRARVEAVGLGPRGWDADVLRSALAAGRHRLAYLIPDFQNPTGHLMPAELRRSLAATAHATGTTLVADETFVEMDLDLAGTGGPMPPSMAALDRHGRVVTVGGMSKSHWGGLRIGWVRCSPMLAHRLTALRGAVDMGGPVLEQLVALRLLAAGDRPVAHRRAALVEQRDALVAALAERLPEWRFRVPRGGMSLWVELDEPVSSALARAAEDYGVRLAPGPRFGAEGTMERFLRLPFARPAAQLREVVDRLAAARAGLTDHGRGRPTRWTEPPVVA
jgi:DNA-binding transcriptional MocR family regulator